MSSKINNKGNGTLLSTLDKVIKSSPITPQIFFECLVPVAKNARPAALAFADQFDMRDFDQFGDAKNSEWFHKISGAAKSYFGLNSFFLFSLGSSKVIFYKNTSLASALKDIDQRYTRLPEEPRWQANEKLISISKDEGSLIGIPACCVNNYAASNRKVVSREGIPPEVKIKLQLMKLAGSADQVRELDEKVLRLFWAMEVFPCSLSCEQSAKQGQKILDCFGDEKISKMYRNVMMVSNAVWVQGYVPPLFESMVSGKPLKFDYDKLNRRILEELNHT